MVNNAVNWFEIPALNIDRAYQFYYNILNGKVRKGDLFGQELILFDVPFNKGSAVDGSIVVREDLQPTTEGGVIYINTFNQLDSALGKVEANGGEIIVSKMDLGDFGYSAIIRDSEGKKIGLHESK